MKVTRLEEAKEVLRKYAIRLGCSQASNIASIRALQELRKLHPEEYREIREPILEAETTIKIPPQIKRFANLNSETTLRYAQRIIEVEERKKARARTKRNQVSEGRCVCGHPAAYHDRDGFCCGNPDNFKAVGPRGISDCPCRKYVVEGRTE